MKGIILAGDSGDKLYPLSLGIFFWSSLHGIGNCIQYYISYGDLLLQYLMLLRLQEN